MADAIRVVVVDDHPMVLRGTCEMLESASDVAVVGRGRDGDEALNLVATHRPDVLLTDLQMPRRDGLSVVRELRARGETLGIVVLTSADDETSILRALQAGANGYMLKTADEPELLQAIRLVAEGKPAILQPEVARAMMASWRTDGGEEALSEREVEILKTLAKDLSNKEIARHLGISDRTVQQHLSNIFSKLGVASRTGAVLKALRMGTITLEDARP
ncbi:MAG: response regulator transcription factor [Candidatus Sericytochromatia bacterium]|nr:response regulator transcription factor [Candidatus Sericytochromatia bacterium]